jgi:limonene-1,2-epoxide hydrolase
LPKNKSELHDEYASDPLEVVSTFMTALGKKDFNTALQYLSDDCEYTNIPISTVHGPVAVRTVLEAFRPRH